MATKKAAAPAPEKEEKQPRKTQKLNVWLMPEQLQWLKNQSGGASAGVRALITEAMNMEKLAQSLKKGTKKKRSQIVDRRS